MTQAMNHCLEEEVFAGAVREKMNGVGWAGWSSDPGHQGSLDGLTGHAEHRSALVLAGSQP